MEKHLLNPFAIQKAVEAIGRNWDISTAMRAYWKFEKAAIGTRLSYFGVSFEVKDAGVSKLFRIVQ